MKNKAIQKFSPFALGMIVFLSQMAQGMAYGASLKSTVATDDPLLKTNVSEQQPSTSSAGGGCSPSLAGSGLTSNNSSTPAVNAKNLQSSGTSASPSVLASSVTGSLVPSSVVANAPVSDPASASNFGSNLVAQVPGLDDCCEIGGTTTCEVGGLAPAGGGALGGGFPLAALAGLAAPLALIPALGGGGGGGGGGTPPPPVPEPASTAAITAGLGLLGLWYGRRFRTPHKASS